MTKKDTLKVMQLLPRMEVGGVERGVLDLCLSFKGSFIENIVVSSGGKLAEQLKTHGITHYTMNVGEKSLFSLFLISRLRRIIEQEKIDIIHARSRVPAWLGFLASFKTRATFITTAHGVYKSKHPSEVMGWGKFVICPSKVVARHMHDTFCVPQEKIVIIPRWVDIENFPFHDYATRKHSNVIVSIGRVSPSKGYEYLIEAFAKAVRFNPYLTLKIVGSPDSSKLKYFSSLKTLVRRLSLQYNVQFVQTRHDIGAVLKEARILIAPSTIEESFGRVVIEAFASGVPVIATNVGGFKEIIDHDRDGILIEPRNPSVIAQELIALLNNPEKAEQLVTAARKKLLQKYTMQECLKQNVTVYKETLALRRILVIKISSLGDIILIFSSLKALKDRFPHSTLCVLTHKKYSSLLYGCPFIDEVITVPANYKAFSQIRALATNLRRKSFDYLIDFQNSRASHLIAALTMAKMSIGYSLRCGFLLKKHIVYNRNDNPLASQEKLLNLLGINLKEKKLIFWEQNTNPLPALTEGKFIGINVAASLQWESKNYPLEQLAQLIKLLHKNFPLHKIVLFGDQSCKPRAQKIVAMTNPRPINLCAKTSLQDLPAAIKQMSVFITPDTATLHLAVALGIPTIALFGPTNPLAHTVACSHLHILCKKLPCSFCYDRICQLTEKNRCLQEIPAQMVLTKIREVITP